MTLMDTLRQLRDESCLKLERLALNARDGKEVSEDEASPSTRLEDGEPRIQVLLLREANLEEGRLVTVHGHAVQHLARAPRRGTTIELQKSMVSVARSAAPPGTWEDFAPLGAFVYIGRSDDPESLRFSVGIVDRDGRVRGIKKSYEDTWSSAGVRGVRYTREEGYTYERKRRKHR